MTVPGNDAAARRERLLRRTRTITLGIAGGAAVASLGLGTALAHVIPGHARPATAQAAVSGAATSGHGAPASTAPAGTAPAGTPAAASPPPARVPHHRHRLAAPPRPPASTPAAPQVSSGGS